MANNAITIQVPRKVIVPLTRVVTGVAIGLVNVAAEFADESLGLPARQLRNVQTILPIVGVVAGIGLDLTKSASMRVIGNDMAVGFGTIATLRLGNVARAALAGRKMKNLRQVALGHGSSQIIQSRGISAPSTSYIATTMSLA